MYYLDCSRARIISVFDDAQVLSFVLWLSINFVFKVCTSGTLRVTFNLNLKIHLFEFDAHSHVEYLKVCYLKKL